MVSLAGPPPQGTPVPSLVTRIAAGESVELVWLNLDGGLTARLGADRYLKWSSTGSLAPERERLQWAAAYHPVPRVLEHGVDGEAEWFVTAAIDGASAVAMPPVVAARALGAGLRALHENLSVDDCPFSWSPRDRGAVDEPPADDLLVVCHGDACVPNTLVGADREWMAHVDLGALGVADRWADLAVASASLGWNFGPGLEEAFFAAYGVEPDEERIRYYRNLWELPA